MEGNGQEGRNLQRGIRGETHAANDILGNGEYMGPVEEAPKKKFLTKQLGLEIISGRMKKLLAL